MDKKRVLVVDDEEEFCKFLSDYLKERGCAVELAYDGMQAKDLLEKKKYDYIFIDCNMPELTGVELLKVIKERNPSAKKVMVSAYQLIDEGFAKDLGADIFLTKPVSLEAIREIVENG